MKKYLLLSAIFAGSIFGKLNAQLTGTLTVPGSYPTLAAAITDLNTQGVGAGGVTISLLAGNPQTAPSGGYVITASGTAANLIMISGNGNTITASGAHAAGALNDGIFKIVGGDYISIINFVMQENAANTDATPGTNTMTEWGVALLYASTTNGAQNNAIMLNTISLNRAYSNTWGVYSNVRHSATSIATTADITSPLGANSFNIVYGNTFSNVNMGVAFIGSGTPANMDAGNIVGGASPAQGNTFTDWGGAAAASSYVSNSGTSYCIFMNHQTAYGISNNSITSANVTPTVTFRAIAQDYTAGSPTGTFTNTISANTITMTSGQTSGTFRQIDCGGGVNTMTLDITNNTILNCAITGAGSTAVWAGISNSGGIAALNITGNVIRGGTTTTTSSGFTGIQNSGLVTGTINLNNNQIGNSSSGAITFSVAASGTVTGISNSGGAAGSTLNMNNNNIQGIVHAVTGSGVQTYLTNTGTNPNTNINNNTFTNLTVNTTGSLTFISNNVTHAPNTTHNVNNNSIVTAFSKTGAGGTILFYNSFSTSLTAVTEVNTGNNFSNMTFTGAATITGWRSGDGSTSAPYGSNKTVTNNTFSNITGGTGTIQILEVDYSNSGSTANNVSGNIITNITGGNNVTGIISGQGSQNFFNNLIAGLYSTGNGTVIGISVTNGATQNIYMNRIGDLQTAGTGQQAIGIRVSGGAATTVVNITNNLIGDLRAPSSSGSNQVMGISVTATTAGELINIFYNTVYLNATSTGTDFGTSGIQGNSGPNMDLRNNLVVNTSTPNGIGLTVAYRRNNTTLTTYQSGSGNNSFYAGNPAANRLIYYDGTNSDQTLSAFRTRVAPRDANSVTVNSPFITTAVGSAQFLHIPAATISPLESRGVVIAGYTTDYDNDARPGPVGSVNGGGTAPDIGADEFDGTPACNSTPTAATIVAQSSSVCAGSVITISETGASTLGGINYQWQSSAVSGGPYTDIPGATTNTYTTTATATMYYVFKVICGYSDSYSTSNEVLVTVNALPTVTANATSTTACSGSAVTFTGSGGTSYAWSGGVTDNVPFTVTSTNTYTVTGTDANGCTDSDQITVTVNALPTVTANTTATAVCNGNQVTLSGSGATSYAWTGSVSDNVPFTPTVTDTYTVTGTDGNGCTDTDVITVTVNTLPTVTANATSTAVCDGNSVTLSGSGATSYAWTGSVTDNVPFTPTVTDTYTVTGTDGNGCTDTDVITVTVNTLPTVTANTTATAVCDGSPVTLSGSGATSYAWTGSVSDNVPFTPTVTDTYTVTGTDGNGCTDTDMITVTVNALPSVTASVSDDTICDGDQVTFNGGGAVSYTWTGSVTDNVAYTPVATDTYTVTGTDANGCMNTASIEVVVNALPSVSVTLPMDTICQNVGVVTLTGETPAGGTWSGPGVTGNTIDPVAAGLGTIGIDYMFTDANGCSAMATDSVVVDLCMGVEEAVSADATIYPNPNAGQFTIQLSAVPAAPVQVEIMNELGQVVNAFTTSATTTEVNISNYEGGVYFVRLIEGNAVRVYRAVKQ